MNRARAALGAAILLLALAVASPASAGTGHSVQTYLTSQLGDWVGKGRPSAYATPTFDASVLLNQGSADIELNGAGAFLAALFGSGTPGEALASRLYPNAARQNAPGQPHLDVAVDGAGCYNASGWFRVLEVSYSGSAIASLAVDFEQHCELAANPALFGSIRVNSSIPIDRAALDKLAAPTFDQLHPSDCPQLTDSVYRLYTAYFLREPDTSGWTYWQSVYGQTPASLETISWSFAASEEFRLRYGALANRAFVQLIYANVLGRQPDPVGWDHWTNALDRGYGRGAVMLAFSESEEYTNLTGTAPPMAGYLQWYTAPVTFVCGRGSTTVSTGGAQYLDVMVVNESAADQIGYQLFLNVDQGALATPPDVLGPDSLVLLWNQPLRSLGVTSVAVSAGFGQQLSWAMVFYGHPHSATRSPYSDVGQLAQLTTG